MKFVRSNWFIISVIVTILLIIVSELIFRAVQRKRADRDKPKMAVVPDIHNLGNSPEEMIIRYGQELITNTAAYFGPHGKLSHAANGLNCQNCHQSAGLQMYSGNYYSVASTYPRYRERSGTIETVNRRLYDCFHRSLGSQDADTNSSELKAMAAYITWVGKELQNPLPEEFKNQEIPYITRAADTSKGWIVYVANCKSCHQENGGGMIAEDSINYKYPPLWGDKSYTVSAGMYRNSKLAAYIKYNMPLGSSFLHPTLSNEEAWDVAAFINSQKHPRVFFAGDWPLVSSKPVDYPFGPYNDSFSEARHKYGPYQQMVKQ